MRSPAATVLLQSAMANAAEIKVLSTQATEEAYKELVPQFEKASGHKVTTIFTGTLDVQKRITAGEAYDIIIMAGPAIADFLQSGHDVLGGRVALPKPGPGFAGGAWGPRPHPFSSTARTSTPP